MPPVSFIGSTVGVLNAATTTFTLPLRARVGDVLVAVAAFDNSVAGYVGGSNPGWDYIDGVGGAAKLYLLRRTLKDTDGPTLQIVASSNPVWQISTLLVFRQLDAAAPNAGALAVNAVAGSTNFVCPSQTLTAYSDAILTIGVNTSNATSFDPPGGGVELVEIQTGGRTLGVALRLREAVGASGTLTMLAGVASTGMAASILYKAMPTPLATVVKPDIAGAIGFVEIGV